MCTNGVNGSQYKMMIEQTDDQIALNRRWTHKLFHIADDAGYAQTAAALKEAQGLLDEVRAQLSDAMDALDKDIDAAKDITVELV